MLFLTIFSLRELSKIVFSAIIENSQRMKGRVRKRDGRILRGGMKIGNRGRESTERNDHLGGTELSGAFAQGAVRRGKLSCDLGEGRHWSDQPH